MMLTSFLCANLKAQYFHHVYANDVYEVGVSGLATTSRTSVGHIICGSDKLGMPNGPTKIKVVKTNQDGRFTNPTDFKAMYEFYDNMSNRLEIGCTEIIELSAGGAYGITGTYLDRPTSEYGIYYVELDNFGSPTVTYAFPTYVTPGFFLKSLKESVSNPGELYITGTFMDYSTSQTYPYVFKFDRLGNYIWDYAYDIINPVHFDGAGWDMVEDPSHPGTGVLVGSVAGQNNSLEALFLTFNLSTGLPISANTYGTPTTSAWFTRIKNANGPAAGFVIAGNQAGPSSAGPWVINIDGATYSTNWSYTYPVNLSHPGAGSDIYDIIERLNTSGNYEYYAVGNAWDGDPDLLVLKIDGTGNQGIARQLLYGPHNPTSPYDIQYGYRIDQNNTGSGDGFSAYGLSHSAGSGGLAAHFQFYIVKAYFNGESGCQQNIQDPIIQNYNPVSAPVTMIIPYTVLDGSSHSLTCSIVATFTDAEECYNKTLLFGNNNYAVMPENPAYNTKGVDVSTLETAKGLSSVQITSHSDKPTQVNIKIYDMLGRIFYSADVQLQPGVNSLPTAGVLNEMATGMYRLDMSGTQAPSSQMILLR